MKRLLTLGVILISSFSIGSEDECCKQMTIGDHLYHYVGWDDNSQSQYNCDSSCVYSTDGNPGKRVCFKKELVTGEKSQEKSVCHDDSINNFLTTKSPVAIDWFYHMPSFHKCVSPGTKVTFQWFGGQNVNTMTEAEFTACDVAGKNDVAGSGPYTWSTSQTGNYYFACGLPGHCLNGNMKAEIVVSDDCDKDDCDRDCATSQPLTCVFNFTLEMLRTDTNGRRADGRIRTVLAYNGKIPGPPIVICEGDELVLNFKNRISETMANTDGSTSTSTLHFHGIEEKSRPWSDGVPFVTQCPVISGDDFTYGFNSPVDGAPPGTYWYHSHVGSQRTNGAYGALIIKDNGTDPKGRFEVDNATNTLVLQEWYESSTKQIPVSILINGHGRIGEEKNKVVAGDDESEVTLNYLKGKGGRFQCARNEDHIPDNYTTNYAEFDVLANTKYRFRVIGAISQNFPLRLSIDDHKFTAIAMDSLNIQPVYALTDLWLAAGERYDIVVQTKQYYNESGPAYKIRVFGYTNQYDKSAGSLCTIAWMKYPKQDIDYSYVTPCNCSGFKKLPSPRRTLNPVPNNLAEWNGSPANGNYFIKDLKAIDQAKNIHSWNRNTQYIEFRGEIAFNGLRMTYPDVPFLLQDPEDKTDRCGYECDMGSPCTEIKSTDVECHHVLKETFRPGYMTEIVLINNLNQTAAHPIHKHGGWYWVVGEGKYDYTINRTYIMNQDQSGSPLPRNFVNPPAKDTIQVPPQGYVILRTPLDNAGTWIFHCHINYHVTIGMAMVIQIGELGGPKAQEWSIGHLTRNESCKTPPPPPGGGTTTINWFYGMEPKTTRCVAPGMNVTFLWQHGHTVDGRSKHDYESCILKGGNHKAGTGGYPWTAPAVGDYYFACGLDYDQNTTIGGHCKKGNMKAHILVSNSCNSPPPPSIPGGRAISLDSQILGTTSIEWFYGMDFNTTRCLAPGMTVTFIWQSGQNVNQISKEAYGTGNTRECNLKGKYHGSTNGPYPWTAPAVGDYYFACGLDYDSNTEIGGHCKNGNMNAHILVSKSCK
eukprot:GFUD01040418.1.p1 GENE.GFUD01040418.1~~GFUD01040418.1.p1  ORF type:complete len:1040 (+),score=193.32 GFUD01040418.1:3-3122(+)